MDAVGNVTRPTTEEISIAIDLVHLMTTWVVGGIVPLEVEQLGDAVVSKAVSRRKFVAVSEPAFLMTTVTEAGEDGGALAGVTVKLSMIRSGCKTA